MNIYLITRTDRHRFLYEEHIAHVVAATSPHRARTLASLSTADEPLGVWLSPETSHVKQIGTHATPAIERVILTDNTGA